MTTIAYTNGTIACDSSHTCGEVIYTRRQKIVRLSSGGLMGFAGACDTRATVELFDKVKSEKHLPTRKQILELAQSIDALFIMPNGRIFNIECAYEEEHYWEGGLYEWGERFAACGSGGKFALVAMECGKTAMEAVHAACRRDVNSCPPVHQLTLGLRPVLSRGAKRSIVPPKKR